MMRRTLTALLMLLMLTPAMVCVMTLCPEVVQAAAPPPCHESAPADPDDTVPVPMLAGDCLLNDLGTATAPDLPEPPVVFLVLMFMVPAMLAFMPAPLSRSIRARAPPPTSVRASFHRLLITRRILQ